MHQIISIIAFKQRAAAVIQQAKRAAAPAAHIGYATKGVFYLVLGWLSLQAAIEVGNTKLSLYTVLLQILTQPFGQVLLAAMVFGIMAYIFWRVAQAILDLDKKGTDGSGLIQRIGYLCSGAGYAAIAFSALELILEKTNTEATLEIQEVILFVYRMPLGQLLVALIGVIFLGISFFQFHRTFSTSFSKHFDWSQVGTRIKTIILLLGRIGFACRGVLYVIIGLSLIHASLTLQPENSGGIGFAIRQLDRWNHIPWALGVIAVGLLFYGAYAILLARFRIIAFD